MRLPPRLRLEHLWPMVLLAIIFFWLSTHPIRPHDFWWHLRAGQKIVSAGLPAVDQFSQTMAGWSDNSYAAFWPMELPFFRLYFLGGPTLFILGHALLITAAWLKHLLSLPVVRRGLTSAETPVEAVDYLLQESLASRLFRDMGFGSYLI